MVDPSGVGGKVQQDQKSGALRVQGEMVDPSGVGGKG